MKPKSRKEDLVVQEANGEVLIYDLRSDKAFCLNETSALVWNACDGNRDVNEIRRDVSKRLNTEADHDLIWLALDQLKQQDLLAAETTPESPLNGLSRREVIKKIGLSSAIALPVVLSLVAPKATMAQTCLPNGTVAGGPIASGTNCSAPNQGARDAACASQRGSLCCSGNAVATACAGAGSQVTCTCAP